MNTLLLLFVQLGSPAYHLGPILAIEGMDEEGFRRQVSNLLCDFPKDPEAIASQINNKKREKFDYLAPESLLIREVAIKDIDLEGAYLVLRETEKNFSS